MKRRLFIKSSGSAAAAVVLTACGGGGGGGSAVDASSAGAASATASAVPQPGSLASALEAGPAPESAVPAPTPAPAPAPAPTPAPADTPAAGPFNVGVNVHTGGSSVSHNAQIAAILQARNFKRIRMDYFWTQDQTLPRDLIARINGYGGSVEMSLQISYQWDHTVYTDLAAVQAKAYRETYTAVDAMKDVVHDFELLNEVQLRSEILAAVPWNSAGTSKTPYQNKPAMASLAAVLRGMANAIHDVAAKSALPLRVVMGVIGRDFGLLSYLRDEGVQWDVTGFHVYPHERAPNLRTDTWYGPGGPLAQLAAFGKPVTLNEFNAGEIYDAGYENAAGQPVTESGLRSTARHMLELYSQTECQLESVVFYELLDAPSKPAPENRFGLMFNLDAPKDLLYLATALAGGTLSSPERVAITSRGLLTDGQIDAMRRY
jgi:hypothetical protein